MGKELSNMTNEELWGLFPIILCEHQETWKESYQKEKEILEGAIGRENIARMSHYGSTSVSGLIAKPTIDILLEIKEDYMLKKLVSSMRAIGYIYDEQPDSPPPHMIFMKGYTPQGFRGQVFHVHVRYLGDWGELYFRDLLKEDPQIAEAYGKLKLELKKEYEHNRDGYTAAKSEFIKTYTEMAREMFKDRYNENRI